MRKAGRTTTAKKTTSPGFRLRESDIQRTCEDLLRWDFWRILRIEKNFSEKKQKATGELGAPDALCIRYGFECPDACAEVLWIEWKAADGRLSQDQADWHAAERTYGALTLIAGKEFPATIEGFKAFYAASGLQRRK